jgi:metallo-beta-lactamase family protein
LKLAFYGACRTVTGSCFLLETEQTKILVDCGMYHGPKELKERNYGDFPFNPGEIDCVVLTHAHIDHSGLLPKLVKKGFKGNIFATKATMDLCSIMLPDSGHIQELEVERKNRKLKRAGQTLIEPIYDHFDANKAMLQFKGIDYDIPAIISPDVTIKLKDAGHILGSSIAEVFVREGNKEIKMVFSGDIGNLNQPIIKNPTKIKNADYLIMESTYGNRTHQDMGDKKELILKIIKDTFKRGGNLVIPAFAVERTQDILYYLGKLEQEGRLPACDIYVDSPLAISASEIFKVSVQYYDDESRKIFESTGNSPIVLKNLTMTRSVEESRKLNEIKSGAIIISASGMCDAGRIKHHLKHNLWRAESSVLFVGFQAEGTLGRKIIDGQKIVRIHGEDIAVNANIYNLDGFSAHADQPALLDWVKSMEQLPEKLFLVHGEPTGMAELKGLFETELGVDVEMPDWQESFTIGEEKTTPFKKTQKDIDLIYNALVRKLEEMYKHKTVEEDFDQLYRKLKDIEKII